MGVIAEIFGLGKAVKDVAEVFVPNKTEQSRFEHLEHSAALEQFGTEFARDRGGWFNNLVDAMNRLPRPVLALGTVGLFGFAMVDPLAFSGRMQGLDSVPRELWWLLGAIVSFYFGARELHYVRRNKQASPLHSPQSPLVGPSHDIAQDNAAVADWLKSRSSNA